MSEPRDPNRTVDVPQAPADSLDAGLAAGFGPPRSSLGDMRPPLLKEAEGESAHVVKPKSDAMPPPEQTGDRYQLQGEIARGGMGAVLRGRDVDLGRDLAIKVLLEKHAHRPEVVRRFIEEAQIGGQLQHPGVVPVYDIGRFGARPFFTMKLVKGQTLAALLGERADPAAERPRFLAIALQVAQTLAYAHAKGVIHRDLKPANIMVGAFGEVQVMDWGLAKVLAEGGTADEERASRQHQEPEDVTTIRTARSSGSAGGLGTETEAGSLLGTPAYMPPEQANGEVALLDRRADVFGLGAILCEVLTGKPPYVGRSSEEVRRKACNGNLADATARLDACGADPELVALTKGCLAAEAIDRPKDAQAVADGLSAYLNGVQERLQTAERERAVAVARGAEQRKRRKVQLALAAAVLALLLGGGAFAWWRNQQAQAARERDARNAEAVAALLGQAEEALRAGDAAKAAVALEAARKRSDEGGAEQEAQRLAPLAADLALLHDLDAVDQFRWTFSENKPPDPAAVAMRTRAALARFGADPGAVSAEAAARVSASVVRERIVSALDRLLQQQKKAGVRTVLRRVDADPYRDAVRDAVLAHEKAKMVALAERKAALEQPPGFVAFLGEIEVIPVERRRHLLAAALRHRPGDLGLLMTLGHTYPINQEDGANERLRWYQAAVATAPGNAAAHNGLGVALGDRKDLAGAEAAFRKAIALDPKYAAAHNNLAVALASKGQQDEAIAEWKKALALDPKLARPHSNLGLALAGKGRWDEALACYQKAIQLDPKLARPHNNLGAALYGKGQVEEAIACYKKAIALDPKLAQAHTNLGNALAAKGELDQAIACYRKCIELDPKLAAAHTNLGKVLRDKGQLDEAIACCRKAIELDPKYAWGHYNLGLALQIKGQLDKAIACYQKAIELDPKHAWAHCNLGVALRNKGQMDEAIASYKKAIALDPNDVLARSSLAAAYQSVIAEAAALPGRLEKLLESNRNDGQFQAELATHYATRGNNARAKAARTKARALFEKQLAREPQSAALAGELARVLLDELRATEPEWVVLKPAATKTESGARLTLQGDGSILVEGTPRREQQTVRWQPGPQPVGAVRIETSTHASAPTNGAPLFNEYLAVAASTGASRPWVLCGQFVRLDLPGDNSQFPRHPADKHMKTINLAELQVFRGDQNIALRKKARQSTSPGGSRLAAENAVDGNTVGNDAGNPYAHTAMEDDPWWEVDLGSEQPIDRIVIWNRSDVNLYARMNHFRVRVLDRSRKVVFEQVVAKAPSPRAEIVPQALLAATNSGATGEKQPLIVRLPRSSGKDALPRYRVSVALHLADLGPDEERLAILKLTGPWLKLSTAYALIGRKDKASEYLGKALQANPQLGQLGAGQLAQRGLGLLQQKKWAQAEPLIRQSLAIREKMQPDAWTTFNTQSMLGGVLLGQKKYADAEALLLAGYQGMKKRQASIPPQARPRLAEAVERLVQLYEALGKKDEVARWTRERQALQTPARKAESKP
jgi:tetratricopeptide (TPR) repeat protein